MKTVLALPLVLLLLAGTAAGAPAKDVKPFVYTFQVTAVTLDAKFTRGAATATTELKLSSLPKRKSLSWWGKKNYSNANGSTTAVIRVGGTATYAGIDAACDGTVTLNPSRWPPIFAGLIVINARDRVVTAPKITVSAGRFPIASIYSRRGGGCEAGALTWYEGGFVNRPLSVLRAARFSITAKYKKTFEDGAALEWTVGMTVRKLGYRLLDCTRTPLC